MANVLMPQATAVWLLDNTSLTFEQIGDFCELHPLTVQAIADEEVAKGIRGVDPIAQGFLSREEIEAAEADPERRLKALEQKRIDLPQTKAKKGRYTPIARRGDRPDAIAWFLRNHPEVTDTQIAKLLGTTKATIEQVRTKKHRNSNTIQPRDPVSLGLVTQIELDAIVAKAAEVRARHTPPPPSGETLKPVSETVDEAAYRPADEDV